MVCQVMFTTPDVDPVLLPVDVEDGDEAAGPPQAARVSTALVASSAAGVVQLLVPCCCDSQFGWTCVSAHIHGRIVTAHNLIVKGAAVTI
jgi:hypothetical protein